ncbi:oligoendopeptidase F, partial [Staphylococcus pseudintermedius]
SYNNTLEETLAGEGKQQVFDARSHNHKIAREQAMGDNQIPEAVYYKLMKSVKNYLPRLHHYTTLRKELLCDDTYKMYD